ncbi:MAG: M20 family metallopeptidase [Thermoplasmata archaeon]|nr:M20 family metallopeptidase [Thermoplasmata archaeon]
MAGAWSRAARDVLPEMEGWRRAFHREPELSNEETRTQARILATLRELGIQSRTFRGSTAVVGYLGADRGGAAVALRADMDGLPVTETTGLPFRSRYPGRMHACGHDVHMASLLGAAKLLKARERELRGPIVLVFQPAEEDGVEGGARPLLERGIFRDPRVDFVVGQHVAPQIPLGSVGWRSGPMMASADEFLLTVRGTGSHAAFPHGGADAIVVASEIVLGLQTLVSRARDPLDPVVISVGSVHGGTRHNILPETVTVHGTVRTLSATTRRKMERLLRHRVQHLAESHGARVEIDYRRGYPVTSNPPGATGRIVEILRKELGPGRVIELERPVMGAEDFSRYLEKVPGTFLFLGVGEPGRPSPSPHSGSFAPKDRVLVTGAATLASAAVGLQAA